MSFLGKLGKSVKKEFHKVQHEGHNIVNEVQHDAHKVENLLAKPVEKVENVAKAVVEGPVNLAKGVTKDTVHAIRDFAHGDFKDGFHQLGNAGAEFAEQPEAIAHAAGVNLQIVGEVAGGTIGFIMGGPLGAVAGASVGGQLGKLEDQIANHDTITASEVIQDTGEMVLDGLGVPADDIPLADSALQIAGQAIDGNITASDVIKDLAGTALDGSDISADDIPLAGSASDVLQNVAGTALDGLDISADDIPLAGSALQVAGQAIDGNPITPQQISSDIANYVGGPLGLAVGAIAAQAIAGQKINGSTLKQELIQTGKGIVGQELGVSPEYTQLGNSIGQGIPRGNLSAQKVAKIATQHTVGQLSNSQGYGHLGNSVSQAIASSELSSGHSAKGFPHGDLHVKGVSPIIPHHIAANSSNSKTLNEGSSHLIHHNETHPGHHSITSDQQHHVPPHDDHHIDRQHSHSGKLSANDQHLSQHHPHSQTSYHPNSLGQPVHNHNLGTKHTVENHKGSSHPIHHNEPHPGYHSITAEKHHHVSHDVDHHIHHQHSRSGELSANDQHLSQYHRHFQTSYHLNSLGQPVYNHHLGTKHTVETNLGHHSITFPRHDDGSDHVRRHIDQRHFHSGDFSTNDQRLSQHPYRQQSYYGNSFSQPVHNHQIVAEHTIATNEGLYRISRPNESLNPNSTLPIRNQYPSYPSITSHEQVSNYVNGQHLRSGEFPINEQRVSPHYPEPQQSYHPNSSVQPVNSQPLVTPHTVPTVENVGGSSAVHVSPHLHH